MKRTRIMRFENKTAADAALQMMFATASSVCCGIALDVEYAYGGYYIAVTVANDSQFIEVE